MNIIDETHDRRRVCWVASAQGHSEFPIQNLPFGVFSAAGGSPRGGVAIGDRILDLRAGLEADLFPGEAARAAEAAAGATLNPLMACGKHPRLALRRRLSALLSADGPDRAKIEPLAARLLHNAADCTLHLPAAIGSFTDFFAGIHHARNGGMRRDPKNPLNPNYKYVPVAYHSRASSVRPSGVPIRRPSGQRKALDEDAPTFGPAQKLDYELELAVWIGPATSSANRSRSPRPGTMCSVSGSSTTGRRATCRAGNRSRSGRFSPRISARPCPPGSSRARRSPRSGSLSRRGRPGTRGPCPICGTMPTSRREPLTLRSKPC